MSNLSSFLTVSHLSWAIWVYCSQVLIWSEWFEWMSKWVNEQMSDERMSEFPTLVILHHFVWLDKLSMYSKFSKNYCSQQNGWIFNKIMGWGILLEIVKKHFFCKKVNLLIQYFIEGFFRFIIRIIRNRMEQFQNAFCLTIMTTSFE